jgi:hypothetical protein
VATASSRMAKDNSQTLWTKRDIANGYVQLSTYGSVGRTIRSYLQFARSRVSYYQDLHDARTTSCEGQGTLSMVDSPTKMIQRRAFLASICGDLESRIV